MNELTPEQKAIGEMFSLICAIVSSENTPVYTTNAIMQTLERIFNNEDGPYAQNEEMAAMAGTMIEHINQIAHNRSKQLHQQTGNDILAGINWN